nr:hypothetical protein [uncultured Trichococcus sp.]
MQKRDAFQHHVFVKIQIFGSIWIASLDFNGFGFSVNKNTVDRIKAIPTRSVQCRLVPSQKTERNVAESGSADESRLPTVAPMRCTPSR